MKIRTVVAKCVGYVGLAPIALLKGQTIANMVYRKGLRMVVKSSTPYALDTTADSSRSLPQFYRPADAFASRFAQVESTVREVGAHNLLDVGCAEGYMISRAAKELGLFAVGLEMDRQRIRVGNSYSELADDRNYGIIPATAGPELLERVPVFDVVICFSVLHHVIRHHGLDAAIDFLKSIRKITRHRFLFDMGSPAETANDPEWGNVLEFLKDDVVNKNKELLEAAGFINVKHVGDTPGFIKTATRPLFVCSSPGSE